MKILLLFLAAAAGLPAGPEPPNAEEIARFWRGTLERLAKEPMDPQVEQVAEPLSYRKYRITLRGLGGVPFRAYMGVPIQGESGARRLPAIVTAPGYGGVQQGVMMDDCQRGFVVLQVSPRSQGESSALWKIDGPEKLTWHIAHPEGYYYQGAYADMIRGVDFLLARPEVDARRIGMMGTSQGGGIVLAAASLDPRVKAVVAHVPFLCDMRSAASISGSLIQRLLAKEGTMGAEALRTLDYFDPARLAVNLRAPTLISAGGSDTTCPAQTIRTVFDRVSGIKSFVYYPDLPHTTSGGFYLLSWNWMEQYLSQ
jgi:cephalosporin-C deacetylase